MVPDPDKTQVSFPKIKYPIFRDEIVRTPEQWLKGKQILDGAEGLWRVHDNLYDLTDFISSHPGGTQWLEFTEGTDVTEAFETHHIRSEKAETILAKYFVRKAKAPRNSPFTFNNDGFYKTLKTKVAEKLERIPKNERNKSDVVTDLLLLGFLIGSPICCWVWKKNLIYGAASTALLGFVLSSLTICAHNYMHRRDSWRMYLFNISGFSYSEWRVSHAMSHHLHTNTANDLELSFLEPFLQYIPYKNKPMWAKFGAIYYPVIFSFTSLICMLKEIGAAAVKLGNKKLSWANIIPFIIPVWMWWASGLYFPFTIAVWLVTIQLSSLMFMIFGLTAGHHGHENFFEGDVPREEYIDWGIHQLYTNIEREDYKESHFKVLTRFGDHCLHHLFPTVDHAELKFLYPTLFAHCEKFKTQLRMTSFYEALLSQSKQLMRSQPHNFKDNDIFS